MNTHSFCLNIVLLGIVGTFMMLTVMTGGASVYEHTGLVFFAGLCLAAYLGVWWVLIGEHSITQR